MDVGLFSSVPPGTGVLLPATIGSCPSLGDNGDPRWCVEDEEHMTYLDQHLVRNDAGYARWHGTYVGGELCPELDPDPWGNRYAVNIACFAGDDGPEWDIVVISAGPDEGIDSKFAQRGFVAGGDDIVAVVCRARERLKEPRRSVSSD